MSNPADAEAHSHWLAERPLSDAPSRGEAERDAAVDRSEATDWWDDFRAGLAGWGVEG